MKFITACLLILLLIEVNFAQTKRKNFEWNGYGQFRLYKVSPNSQGLMVRRIKLWIKGEALNSSKFRYKLMGVFKYYKTEYFGLLDAYGEYTFKDGYIRFGQQIPEFSLQRLQPDWKIPVVERSSVIDALIPAAQSSARDVGLQLHLLPIKKVWQTSVGVFNGKGANLGVTESPNFLYTLHSGININFLKNYFLHLGISGMYRKVHQQDFSKIFGKNNIYTGNDFRVGIESLLKLKTIEIQAEYLEARFNKKKASGYYAYICFNFLEKNQLVIEVQKYSDLNEKTNDAIWLIAGYNYLLDANNIKFMLSGGTQFNDEYSISAQLQIFFN